MKPVTPEELTYLPPEQREMAAQLLNRGSGAATHGTRNTGNGWHVPKPSQAVAEVLRRELGWKETTRGV